MATSGQLNTNTDFDSYFWVKWEQIGNQDVTNNRTQIKWSCGVYCGHSFYSNAIKMSAVSINGTQVYGGGTYSNYSNGNHTIASGTMWISHTTNGTKTFSISAFTGWLYSNHNYSSSGGSFTLNTIIRQATITAANNFNDEGNPSFTFTNPANATLACWLEPNPIGDHLCERTLSGTSGTFTWKLTDDERKQLRSACKGNSCTCRIGLYSTIGGVQYSSYVDKTLSIVNGNPTFTESQISYADTSAVKDITENPLHIVQNQSNLKVTFTDATAKKEATITKYEITVNGVTKTASKGGTVDFGKINTSSNTEISITVTDSRGNTATAKKTVTVLDWSPPIFSVSLERLNNYEDETYLTVDASISSVNNKNTVAISYQYKENGGSYITSKPIDIENKTQYTISCDKNKAYIFSITVADAFDSITNDFPLSKGKFPLFIDTEKNAVGINDFPAEDEALRVVDGIANFVDGVRISGNQMPDFVVEQGSNGIWIYRKWASGISECWGVTDAITQSTSFDWNVKTSNTPTPSIAYPFTFINPPVVSPSIHIHNLNFWLVAYTDGSTTHTPTYQIARGKDVSEITFKLGFYVFGQWK